MDAAFDMRSLEQLKALGSGRSAPAEVVRLYYQAFREFDARSLWSRPPSEGPTIARALVIAESLRREGNVNSRTLAVEIERACRAAL